MDKKAIQDCVRFFNAVSISINDITTDDQRAEAEKMVEVTYGYLGKSFKTKPLYYREITGLNDVRDIDKTHTYFGGEVYCLDIDAHDWPQPSGKSDLDKLVIDDVAQDGDEEFKDFLKLLANNKQDGYIQIITKEGRPGQYYHNLENNNHWHDLVLLIKEVIRRKGQIVDKQFFRPLIYNWDKGKRASLGFNGGGGNYKMIADLYENIKSIQMEEYMLEIKNLLRYKKQIILQGPPGTGKTKLAKELAQEMVLFHGDHSIVVSDIMNVLVPNMDIPTPTSYNTFKIIKHNTDSVTVAPRDAKNTYNIPYRDIIKSAKFYKQPEQDKESDIGGNKSYIISLANFIIESLVNNQIQILQFHPSYSYEDFVRGIVAESQGEHIEYKNINKVLGHAAKIANENYELSQKDNIGIQQDKWIDETFNDFKEEIEKEIEQNELTLSNSITIFKVESDRFRYGKDWGVPSRINFVEFKKLIKAVLNNSLTLTPSTIPKEISVHAHHRFTYYLALLRIFFDKYQFEITNEKQAQRNFVLIIDEINRANLSSVLGELIYALEYRGEKVESMYAVDGHNEIILPPNLYIIGTMNTADRSVGHIDYAIRRRFAFVDVLPQDLTPELGVNFHKALFDQVADLFGSTYLSPEFDRKDVQLGHSYFIDKTVEGGTMQIRLQYEIKPILNEYIKDGILIGDDIWKKISDLSA